MTERGKIGSDDLARHVFSAANDQGFPVPRAQTTWLVNEVARLVADREIVGFADAIVGGAVGYILTVIDADAYLLRWDTDELEVMFLGQLRGLGYKERTHGLGAEHGYEGEPALTITLEHDRLPGTLTIEAREWRVGQITALRAKLRGFTTTAN